MSKQVNETFIRISKEPRDKLSYPIVSHLDDIWEQTTTPDIKVVFTANIINRIEKDNQNGTIDVEYLVKLITAEIE